jgi:hypothetical protein
VDVTIELLTGRLVKTTAERPGEPLTEREALLALLAVEEAPFTFAPADDIEGNGLRFSDIRDGLCEELNRQAKEQRAAMLRSDAALVFHDAMLAFYRSVCPDVVRAVVDELARGDTLPQVMTVEGRNPALVDWIVGDLLRKRIAHLG